MFDSTQIGMANLATAGMLIGSRIAPGHVGNETTGNGQQSTQYASESAQYPYVPQRSVVGPAVEVDLADAPQSLNVFVTHEMILAEIAFPAISSISSQRTHRNETCFEFQANPRQSEMLQELVKEYNFACKEFIEIDISKLNKAFVEAVHLVMSGLFGTRIFPNISVDPYAEFTFSHKSTSGYIDIGVRGAGELSYHVRNDVDPQKTKYDDWNWENYIMPQSLFIAIEHLREHMDEKG